MNKGEEYVKLNIAEMSLTPGVKGKIRIPPILAEISMQYGADMAKRLGMMSDGYVKQKLVELSAKPFTIKSK